MGSTLIGLAIAIVSALITKHTQLRSNEDYMFLEMCMLCIYPYVSFMVAEGCHLSGIVSIMFCGIAMAHYTYNNLSPVCIFKLSYNPQYLLIVAEIIRTHTVHIRNSMYC